MFGAHLQANLHRQIYGFSQLLKDSFRDGHAGFSASFCWSFVAEISAFASGVLILQTIDLGHKIIFNSQNDARGPGLPYLAIRWLYCLE